MVASVEKVFFAELRHVEYKNFTKVHIDMKHGLHTPITDSC